MATAKTTVVLFTDSFPFRCYTEEVFVLPELQELSNKFQQVIIVPHRITGQPIDISQPNITVNLSMAKSPTTRFRLAKAPWLLSPWVLRRIPALLKETHSPNKLISAWFYLVNTHLSAKTINNLLKYYNLKPDSTLLYSFWFDHVADSFDYLKKQYKAITRAHGHDIFDYGIKHRINFLRNNTLSSLKKVYCASNDGCKFLSDRYPQHSAKISTQLLGSLPPQKEAPLPESGSNVMTLFSCSRVAPEKRVELCLKTAAAIAEAYPFKKIKWIHVGGGPLMPRLRIKTTQTDMLPPNLSIELRGPLPNSEVHKIYQNEPIHWFMLLSTTEGLPIAITEAMSYGIPVITTDVGGNSEIVTPETGILLPSDFNPKQIAGEIQPYIIDNDAYMQMRASAFSQWQNSFNANTLRHMFANSIRQLL